MHSNAYSVLHNVTVLYVHVHVRTQCVHVWIERCVVGIFYNHFILHICMYLQAVQVGHLLLFFVFAEYFSWWNYVSHLTYKVHVYTINVHTTSYTFM